MFTKEEFIEKLRDKYPVYDDLSDDELYSGVLSKYPIYATQIDDTKEEKPGLLSKVGSGILETGGKIGQGLLNVPADIINIGSKAVGSDFKVSPLNKQGQEYEGGFLQRVGNIAGERGSDLIGGLKQGGKGDIGQGVYQGVGATLGGISETLGETFMTGLKTIVPDDTQEQIKGWTQEKMETTEIGRQVAGLMTEFQQNMDWLKVNDPEGYRNWRATFGILSGTSDAIGVTQVKGIYKAGESAIINSGKVAEMSKDALEKVQEAVTSTKTIINNKTQGTGQKIDNILNNYAKTSKNYVKAISPDGQTFEVEVSPTLYQNATDLITQSRKTNTDLAGASIFPKLNAGKTSDQKMNANLNGLKGVEQLYNDRAKGFINADIHTMGGGVGGVHEGLEYWGKIIGELTDLDEVIDFRTEINELRSSLGVEFAKLNPEMYNRVKSVVDIFDEVGDSTTVRGMQRALSNIKTDVFKNAETTKELSSTSTGKALGKVLDSLQEKFDATIDINQGDSRLLKEAKKAYSKYKRIQKDLEDSFLVSQRHILKGLTQNAGSLAGVVSMLENPSMSGFIKGVLIKHAGEVIGKSGSRDGSWETLIRNLDRDAITKYRKELDNLPTVAKNSIPEDELIEFVQELGKNIDESFANQSELKNMYKEISGYTDIPQKYQRTLLDKIDNYLRNIQEVNQNIDNASLYQDSLKKSFNQVYGIEKRVKKGSFDKMNQVEFQTSPAYKKFSDEAQNFINTTNSDMTVQELYERMKDEIPVNKKEVQTENTGIKEFDESLPPELMERIDTVEEKIDKLSKNLETEKKKVELSDKGGIKTVSPLNQAKFNQGDNFSPVRIMFDDKDRDIIRYGALNTKRHKQAMTNSEMDEMKGIIKTLGLTREEILARSQEIKDLAKKARTTDREVILNLDDIKNLKEKIQNVNPENIDEIISDDGIKEIILQGGDIEEMLKKVTEKYGVDYLQ